MTHDETETARALIGQAFENLFDNAPTINGIAELAEKCTEQLAQDADLIERLDSRNTGLVFSITIHKLGEQGEYNQGSAEIKSLTLCDSNQIEQLAQHLTSASALALGFATVASAPDGDRALVSIISAGESATGVIVCPLAEMQAHSFSAQDDSLPKELLEVARAIEKACTK